VGLYETRNQRWIAILTLDEKNFTRLTRAMGREELAQDPRFDSMVQRGENCDVLSEVVSD
jgi:crotonobetainyl-CoA:carnitine CoA-transferase CaiB-like acyl-CoA transferase